VNRQTFIDRLRAWAMRADHEAVESDGTARLAWQGQADVLHALASVVAAGSGGADPAVLRQQIIFDRQKALAAWNEDRDPVRVAPIAGAVQGYELVLDLLQDVDSWSAPQAAAR
jgi:microcystin degradation protein MlrC